MQKATPLEWFLRIAIIGGLVYGGSILVNNYLPTITEALDNIWLFATYAIPTIIVVGYVLLNPMFVWQTYVNFCKKITSFFIKMDPLSYMDRYADLIEYKLNKVRNQVLVSLKGKQKSLMRVIDQAKHDGEEALKLGKAAQAIGNQNQVAFYGNTVNNAKGTVSTFTPLLTSLNGKIDFLEKLTDNWDYSAKQLRQTIDVKRREYEVLKDVVGGLKEADSWINSDNEAAKIYAESLKALEENVTQKLGYIDQFETNSKGLMESMALEKSVHTQDGIAALDAFDENEKFFLPTDWSTNTVDVDYVEVKPKIIASGKFDKFLN